jgi:hypothetical protein
MPSYTANLNLGKPTVTGDSDAWGGYLNTDLDTLDGVFTGDGTGTGVGLKIGPGQVLNAVGRAKMQDLVEIAGAMTSTTIDLSLGRWFEKTVTGNMTFAVSNVPATGQVAAFMFKVTNGGAHTVTWWSGVKWDQGSSPTLTMSGVDLLGFITADGGTSYYGLILGQAMA